MNEIKKLENRLSDLQEEEKEIIEKINDLKLKEINLDFENKYIRYQDDFGITHYCLVDWITKDRIRYSNFAYSYLIRGLGFSGEFLGYSDCTHFYWDYSYEFYLYSNSIDEFKKMIGKIEIITKEEFDTKLCEMRKQLFEYHKSYKTS